MLNTRAEATYHSSEAGQSYAVAPVIVSLHHIFGLVVTRRIVLVASINLH